MEDIFKPTISSSGAFMTQDTLQSSFKILKIGSCYTLSGKGTLGYQIGSNASSDIFLRVTSNTGGGWFSGEWISLKSISSALDSAPTPLTSYALQKLFQGKSVNTPAFLFASLKQEGLVDLDPENPRCYVRMSPDSFLAEMRQLISAGTDLKAEVIKSKQKTKDVIPVIASKTKPPKP